MVSHKILCLPVLRERVTHTKSDVLSLYLAGDFVYHLFGYALLKLPETDSVSPSRDILR